MSALSPSRGEVWTVNFEPTVGHEQQGTLPALVVSINSFNRGPADLIIVLPITSKQRGIASHIAIKPPEGGLSFPSYIKCEDVRCLSKQRFARRHGAVSAKTMVAVEDCLRILMGL